MALGNDADHLDSSKDEAMNQGELELFTTKELVDELMRRRTFLGVVVHAEDDYKCGKWPQDGMFKVRFNANLKSDEACRLLSVVADYLQFNNG